MLIFSEIIRFIMEQDIIIKFCVVGEPSVGKTSMLYQYVHHKFDEKVRPTIGCDFSTKLKSSLDDKAVRLQLWDIAGQQRFSSVSSMYLRGALGCVIVCSANDLVTLNQTLKWKRTIQQHTDMGGSVKIPCLLVQNKSDLINNEKPEQHQTKRYLEQFAKTNDFCGFMQCSAKNNKNIQEVFQGLLDQTTKRGFVKNSPMKAIQNRKQSNIKLDKQTAPISKNRKKEGCC